MNKEKKKQYLKNNIICFVIGTIIFGAIGIYAIVTFPSNEVSYDNKSSGLSSTNVKGAIDELYTECNSTTSKDLMDNLEKDQYECRYFFTGANPNNYITFNNEKAGWRIISVECDGTIKIMRINSIGSVIWSTSGSNSWNYSTIRGRLDTTYYNSLTGTAKSQIVTKDFSIGAVNYNENNLQTTINNENQTTWNGKIALPTVSEYIRSNSNKNNCGTINRLWFYTSGAEECGNTTWMNNETVWWTLTTYTRGNDYAFEVIQDGRLNTYRVDSNNNINPTLYLKSNIKLSGSGTQSDPFQIQ